MEMPARPGEVLGVEEASWCLIKITLVFHPAGQESRKKVRRLLPGLGKR